jgi:hypothetical protein
LGEDGDIQENKNDLFTKIFNTGKRIEIDKIDAERIVERRDTRAGQGEEVQKSETGDEERTGEEGK